jgi:hypothetical protein
MSNSKAHFFTFLLILGIIAPIFSQQMSSNEAHQEKLRAEVYFEQENHKKALTAYEGLYQSGYYSEKSLYRLAFLHEQEANWVQAVYFLKKIQIEYGGDELGFRLAYLEDKLASRLPVDRNGPSMIEANIYRNLPLLSGICLVLLILGACLLFWGRASWLQGFGLTGLSFALLMAGLIVFGQYGMPERAVLTQTTAFHAQAAYASAKLNLPLEPGQSVKIEERNDIWCKVSQGSFRAWVPYFSLRSLNK